MQRQPLLLLLVAAVVHGHAIIKGYYIMVNNDKSLVPMTWSQAREECNSSSSGMFTQDLLTFVHSQLTSLGLGWFWTGLRRGKKNDSAWHWIKTTFFVPTAGDVSPGLAWAENSSANHCVLLGSDSTWLSRRCREKQGYYCSSAGVETYKPTRLPWFQAQERCRLEGGELSFNLTETPNKNHANMGWIGVYREGGDTWRSMGGDSVGPAFSGWRPGEPTTYDCGAFNAHENKWRTYPCDQLLNVACYSDNLLVVTEEKTWEEALEHCRNLQKCSGSFCEKPYELLSVENTDEFNYVRKRISGTVTDEVWTGLRFLRGQWWWVDGQQVNAQELPPCPKAGHHCGVISKTVEQPWLSADCSKKLNFVCYAKQQAGGS